MSGEDARICLVCGTKTTAEICPADGARTRVDGAEDSTHLHQGEVVGGRYVIEKTLGAGGFSVVYAAKNVHTGERVAVKVMRWNAAKDDERIQKRFDKEVQILARLQSPAVVRVCDAGITDRGDRYLVMDYIRGLNLKQLLKVCSRRKRSLTEAEVIDVLGSVFDGLQEAHGLGLVHRDIKPANIMLTADESTPLRSLLVDFGVARSPDSDLTTGRQSLGTPTYMSPEQCKGLAVDGRADVYALGCVLFEALTGSPPFRSRSKVDTMWQQVKAPIPDPQERVKYPLSNEIRSVMRLAMAKEPQDRFASVAAMGRALQRIRQTLWSAVAPTRLVDLLEAESLEAWEAIRAERLGADPQVEVDDADQLQFGKTVSVDLSQPSELSAAPTSTKPDDEDAVQRLIASRRLAASRNQLVDDAVKVTVTSMEDTFPALSVPEEVQSTTPADWSAVTLDASSGPPHATTEPEPPAAADLSRADKVSTDLGAEEETSPETWKKGTLVGTGFEGAEPSKSQ